MLKKIGLDLLIGVVAVTLGVLLGRLYANGLRGAVAAAKLDMRQRDLLSMFHAIGAGRLFADIPLWQPDGTTTVSIRHPLPRAGLVICTSGESASCIETVGSFGAAWRSVKDEALPSVIVSEGDPARHRGGVQRRARTNQSVCAMRRALERDN